MSFKFCVRLYTWDLLINAFGPINQIEQTKEGERGRGRESSGLIDVVLCGDRSRGSLVALYVSGEMAIHHLEGGQMSGMNPVAVEQLKEQIGELSSFI